MNKLHSYGKIYNLGHAALVDLFSDTVVIEEKIDGSQFSFGVFNGELLCRSNSKSQDINAPDKLFEKAIHTTISIQDKLMDGWTYRCEYLMKPKHNTLCYSRCPEKNLILFDIDVSDQLYLSYESKVKCAKDLGLECVPLLSTGEYQDWETLKQLLETESCLGGTKIEGLVIKNYVRFGRDGKALMGKFVSEAFKERHNKEWKRSNPGGKDIVQNIGQSLRTEARWQKAVQHLRDDGLLLNEPKDIGSLFKSVNDDILAECTDEIKEELFRWAWKEISRIITRGLPEWYKEQLAQNQFDK